MSEALPTRIERWQLHGAGLEALRKATVALPAPGPNELLVRHDACGICASDLKVIHLGPNHPKLITRDFEAHPVVLGHEVALTIMQVGDALQERFAVGERYIVQADIFVNGVSTAYGYTLEGGTAPYGIVGHEVLNGDHGCYLIPLRESTGYAEAALVEPWACVVASYEYGNYRTGPIEDGRMLIVYVRGALYGDQIKPLYPPGHQPSSVTTIDDITDINFADLREAETGGYGFDDIIVYGTPSAFDLGRILTCLGRNGILNLVRDTPLTGTIPVDVGRVHYEQHLIVSTDSPTNVLAAYASNTRSELKPGGRTWFVGAGGPMGQMHVQRAIGLASPPKTILVTDRHADRLERICERYGKQAETSGIELILHNTASGTNGMEYAPFDDIFSMVSNADLVAETVPALAEGGVYNLFAGIAKGVTAEIDLGTVLAKNQRIIGTSGSSLEDIRHTLTLVEDGTLSTNASLVAVSGLNAYPEALAAVKEGRYPGKTVVFPTLPDLPLLSLEDLQTQLPAVYALLQDGQFWTREAEAELMGVPGLPGLEVRG